MRTFNLVLIFLFLSLSHSYAQEDLDKLLSEYNSHSIPYISVEELKMLETEVIIFDSREVEEYNVSHIKNAIYIGYNKFDINSIDVEAIENKAVIVYCSLGIRSEIIAEKLKAAGIKDVRNLYGGIFEWKNKDYKIYDLEGKPTEKVHAFSKQWTKWLIQGDKVY
jgi:rhodanese-related sulfurtransferase